MSTPPQFELHQFEKANRSQPDKECVAIARGGGWVVVRDDKTVFRSDVDHHFEFTAEQFDTFQDAVRAADLRTALIPAGALDGCCISIERPADNLNVMRSTTAQDYLPADAELVFDDGEIEAFFDGVHNHEFDADGQHAAHIAECDADNAGLNLAATATV